MQIITSKETMQKRRELLLNEIESFDDGYFPSEEDVDKYLIASQDAKYIDFFLYLCDSATELTQEDLKVKKKILKYIDSVTVEQKK